MGGWEEEEKAVRLSCWTLMGGWVGVWMNEVATYLPSAGRRKKPWRASCAKQSVFHPPTYSLIHSFIHPFIHPFIHSFIRPPTHPPTTHPGYQGKLNESFWAQVSLTRYQSSKYSLTFEDYKNGKGKEEMDGDGKKEKKGRKVVVT